MTSASSGSLRHLRHLHRQLPVVAAMGAALARRGRGGADGAEIVSTILPIHARLVRDYVVHVGGDPAAYRTTLPPHMFAHWGLAPAARALAGLPYSLARIINAGCRLEVRAPLPVGRPLVARASIVSVDDEGGRVVIVQRVETGTEQMPDAVIATIRAVIPKPRVTTRNGQASTSAGRGDPSARAIPYDADELARMHLDRDAGLAFALLTGDFNPIHWLSRAGDAAGFGGVILHGFAMLARAIEAVVRARLSGDISRVRVWDARFTRPLRLPAEVGLFARGDDAWLGDARGGTPYLTLAIEPASRSRSG